MALSGEVASLTFEARLTKAPGLALFGENGVTGKEYFLTLKGTGDVSKIPGLKEIQEEEIEFLLILDCSSSMEGNPWHQVQKAVLKVMHMIKANQKLSLTVMMYSNSARFLTLSSDFPVAQKQILAVQASGATNFVSVFDTMGLMLKKRGLPSMNQEKKRDMVAYFMTDGCDTCNTHDGIMTARESLKRTIAAYGQVVHIHALGFGVNHNEEFLESLTMIGTSDGSYNYIDPKMGGNALEERIVGLLTEEAGLVGRNVYLNLQLSGDNQFLGDWFGSSCQTSVLSAFFETKGDQATIETSKITPMANREHDKDLDELIRAAEVGLELSRKVMEPEKMLAKEELRKEIKGIRGGYKFHVWIGCSIDQSLSKEFNVLQGFRSWSDIRQGRKLRSKRENADLSRLCWMISLEQRQGNRIYCGEICFLGDYGMNGLNVSARGTNVNGGGQCSPKSYVK
ncbi:hypothetical protein TCAL_16587 [Tigriopus californicus]|uniref:VWFA domain-containing protein n=1 Tax=Tigriopus californicus TaxID=6832 RepID=A0A553NDU8_TIGCA|nr:hypothetical protein TCAL_16587 [Tigriopus californicus]